MYRAKPLGGRRTLLGKAAAAKEALEAKWRQKLIKSERAPKAYRMDGIYEVDDVINHSIFGVGLTTEMVLPDKMRIFFEDGLKLMKCGPVKG